jgi:RNA 2',3'-cyclic 3'-phosphodiesterase
MPQNTSILRTFIAIELDQKLHGELTRTILQMKSEGIRSVRWVQPENIHLTIKFLGDTRVNLLEDINLGLSQACSRHDGFEMEVSGTGAFPGTNRPRILWAGIKLTQALSSLQKDIEIELHRLGFEIEKRSFSPHLTLGRVSDNIQQSEVTQIAKSLLVTKNRSFGTIRVADVTLFRSDLRPQGSIYTSLFKAGLNIQK